MSDDKNTDPVGLELEEVRMEEAAKDAPVEEKPDDAAALTKENNVNETQMPLFIVFYASIVLMIATGTNYEWNITVRQVLYHLDYSSRLIIVLIICRSLIGQLHMVLSTEHWWIRCLCHIHPLRWNHLFL